VCQWLKRIPPPQTAPRLAHPVTAVATPNSIGPEAMAAEVGGPAGGVLPLLPILLPGPPRTPLPTPLCFLLPTPLSIPLPTPLPTQPTYQLHMHAMMAPMAAMPPRQPVRALEETTTCAIAMMASSLLALPQVALPRPPPRPPRQWHPPATLLLPPPLHLPTTLLPTPPWNPLMPLLTTLATMVHTIATIHRQCV
jgi:hypothetical protein